MDPQRRENGRKGLFDFESCSPDVFSILNSDLKKPCKIMVKASNVLDISQAIRQLRIVNEVHVVEWRGECKEVLYILSADHSPAEGDVRIIAVQIDDEGGVMRRFVFTPDHEQGAIPSYGAPMQFIYEPGAAFQKAGGFNAMACDFGMVKLHRHSHLYTSQHVHPDFPARCYEVVDIVSPKVKNLSVSRAELSLRNFPGSVQDLRKKLKLEEGSDYRIFATTLWDDEKKLIVCKKTP
jgi:THUMP domain-like